MDLSIVTTLYYSENYIDEFYKRMIKSAENTVKNFEIIFVNDGSPDFASEKIKEICKKDDRVILVDLSRNFGHHKALMTGMMEAKGELVFLIDCDLEEDPELLNTFIEYQQRKDIDVVYGVQNTRKGGLFEKISGHFFYDFFNYISEVKIPKNLLTIRIMTRRYVTNLLQFTEREIFLAGLMEHTGFTQLPLEVKKYDKGKTTYSFSKKIGLLVNAVTSFSSKPLIYIFQTGLLITSCTFLYIIYTLSKKIVLGTTVPGYTSLIISIFMFSGIIILFLGIIGIYVAKIYIETKQRPYTVIKEIVNGKKSVQR